MQKRGGTIVMLGNVRDLFHYPVKGLNAQSLDHVQLEPNRGFPFDRVFGYARHDSGFDPNNPKPLPKSRFVVLARDAVLATLDTRYDPTTGVLTLVNDETNSSFDINSSEGWAGAARLVGKHVGLISDKYPTLHASDPHRFTDVSVDSTEMMNAVSLINADSVEYFAAQTGADINVARFRGNIVFSGIPAMTEMDWVGREIAIGDSLLRVLRRTKRCAATQVNLATGKRDHDVPKMLRDYFGHSDMGIYAEVIAGGPVCVGDTLTML